MAAATQILDELYGLLSPSAKAALQAELAGNAKAKELVEQGLQFRKAYLDDEEPPAKSGKTAEEIAAEEKATREAQEKAARERAAAASGNGNGAELKALSDQLAGLTKTLDDRLKNVITKDQLPALEGQFLEKAILNAHLVMEMKAQHKATFNEELDLKALNTYLEDQKKLGRSFVNIRAVYDDMMSEKVTQKKIADGIADGIKQKKSGDNVPGQGSPAALSPAQVALKKLRGEDASNVNDYAVRLQKIKEAREGIGEGAAA